MEPNQTRENKIHPDQITTQRIQILKQYEATLKNQQGQFKTKKLNILIRRHFNRIDEQFSHEQIRQFSRMVGIGSIMSEEDNQNRYRLGVALILYYDNLKEKQLKRIRPRNASRRCQKGQECEECNNGNTYCECCEFHRPMRWVYQSWHGITDNFINVGSICLNLMVAIHMKITYVKACEMIKDQQVREQNLQTVNSITTQLATMLQSNYFNIDTAPIRRTRKLIQAIKQYYTINKWSILNQSQSIYYYISLHRLREFNTIYNYCVQNGMHIIPRTQFGFKLKKKKSMKVKSICHNEKLQDQQKRQIQQFYGEEIQQPPQTNQRSTLYHYFRNGNNIRRNTNNTQLKEKRRKEMIRGKLKIKLKKKMQECVQSMEQLDQQQMKQSSKEVQENVNIKDIKNFDIESFDNWLKMKKKEQLTNINEHNQKTAYRVVAIKCSKDKDKGIISKNEDNKQDEKNCNKIGKIGPSPDDVEKQNNKHQPNKQHPSSS